jgi:hypothetical protein
VSQRRRQLEQAARNICELRAWRDGVLYRDQRGCLRYVDGRRAWWVVEGTADATRRLEDSSKNGEL